MRSCDTQPSIKHQHTAEEEDGRRNEKKKNCYIYWAQFNGSQFFFFTIIISVNRWAHAVLFLMKFHIPQYILPIHCAAICRFDFVSSAIGWYCTHNAQRTLLLLLFTRVLNCLSVLIGPEPARSKPLPFTLDYAVVLLLLRPLPLRTRPLLCVFKLWFFFPSVSSFLFASNVEYVAVQIDVYALKLNLSKLTLLPAARVFHAHKPFVFFSLLSLAWFASCAKADQQNINFNKNVCTGEYGHTGMETCFI